MPNIRPLPEALQKIACEELNEIPERIDEDLQDFREWIGRQRHLRARTDDQFLTSFLRGCKYSLEKAKSKLDKYYTLRTKYPEFYTIQNIDDPRVVELYKMGIGLHLPTPLHETGPRIQYVRPGNYPTDKYTFSDVMAIANAFQELNMLFDDYCVINGYVQILDMSSYTASHILQLTPNVVRKITTFAEDALPLRQRAVHIVNTSPAFDRLLNMIRALMPLKQQQRLFIHGSNWQSLYEHIPQKYLPQELGGENSSFDEINKLQWQVFQEYREYFVKMKVCEKTNLLTTRKYLA
ncbi:clavesin-2 [Musca domestica]|uniref:Clavesin-2 n=1 Tax=Musca domestica TaxID=7370 RepID=A0A9J7IA13_MUSDO|nr:clavesin-2 [Musca domestica]XP_058983549.1 clavesin-2 [Musca domestica]XP_058983550.1 clavesin-2 [Musca domestica]